MNTKSQTELTKSVKKTTEELKKDITIKKDKNILSTKEKKEIKEWNHIMNVMRTNMCI